MPELEKVLDGLERCASYDYKCEGCPYADPDADGGCYAEQLKLDALELLKVQEAVEPTWKNGYPLCGECGFKLHWKIELNNYCPNCGRAVKWDG